MLVLEHGESLIKIDESSRSHVAIRNHSVGIIFVAVRGDLIGLKESSDSL